MIKSWKKFNESEENKVILRINNDGVFQITKWDDIRSAWDEGFLKGYLKLAEWELSDDTISEVFDHMKKNNFRDAECEIEILLNYAYQEGYISTNKYGDFPSISIDDYENDIYIDYIDRHRKSSSQRDEEAFRHFLATKDIKGFQPGDSWR